MVFSALSVPVVGREICLGADSAASLKSPLMIAAHNYYMLQLQRARIEYKENEIRLIEALAVTFSGNNDISACLGKILAQQRHELDQMSAFSSKLEETASAKISDLLADAGGE